MDSPYAVNTLASLAHEGRLSLFRLLVRRLPGRVTPSELSSTLGMAPSLVSAHLRSLQQVGLVDSVRSGKLLLYRAELEQLGSLVDFLVDDCCRGRLELCSANPNTFATPDSPPTPLDGRSPMSRPFNLLFICTRNSARSILAESMVNANHSGRFVAYSAGTEPAIDPHPDAIALLEKTGYDISGIRSKHLSEFMQPEAPQMDFVFTVCDRAANEECASWPGKPITAHWSLPDPVAVKGTPSEIALAFRETLGALERRFAAFSALPLGSLDRMSMQRTVDDIAETDSLSA